VTRRVLLALPLLLAAVMAAPAPADPPNIVLIVADDLRHDAIGRFAGHDLATPSIDGLAARGFVFRNTYAIGSNPGAVCAPSRAMLLTGRPLRDAWQNTRIDGVPTIPSRLRDAGYHTFGTGKWHQSRRAFREGFDVGAEIFFGGCIACSKTSNAHDEAAKQASYEATLQRLSVDGTYEPVAKPGVHVTDRFADAAAAFIARQPADTPFFVYLSFTAPHDPRVAPPEYEARFRDAEGAPRVRLPANFLAEHPFDQGDRAIRDEVLIETPRDRAALAEEIADYHAMTAHMDAAIGRVLQRVADHHRDDTIVIFTSDHGLGLGSHGLMGKQNAYEHSIRAAPLIIAGRGIRAGESEAFAILNDVFPTIVELTGTEAPDGLAGRSLMPIVRREAESVRDEVWYAYKGYSRAIRVGDWKLIRYPHLDRLQLFDLEHDPHELNDVHADSRHAGLIEELSERLVRWEAAAGPG
jgi:arylsulfatase A-like enzyme